MLERILVTGTSGLLGSKIVKLAEQSFDVIPTHHTCPSFKESIKMDMTDSAEVYQVVANTKPDLVLHVAAETGVDKCEKNRDEAWRINAEGTKSIAAACGKLGSKLIYVSTDYVFDGEKGLYVETDRLNPLNYYGWTKLKGEEFVAEYCQNYSIARTSVLYGWHEWKVNFARWVIESLKRKEPIVVVDDHYNSPTLADNLAEVLLELAQADLVGIYHTAGSERISRYNFAVEIAKKFDLDVSLIAPVKMNELKIWIAKRPRDSSLCINKAQKQLKTRFLNIQESLKSMEMNRKESSISFKN